MSKTVKADGLQTPSVAEMPFEEALNKLNSIVEAMENDELPLESLLTQYEDGMKLYQLCQSRLAAAEVRIQQIEKDAAGRLSTRPVEIAPTATQL
jgi:exodeoxyribonuclease VII small subunit